MPEIVVVLSLAQHSDSRATRSGGLFKNWTMMHGFYIIMGGFVLVSHDGTRRTANYHQLKLLNEHHPDLLAPISSLRKEDIADKSKADALVKIIALSQVANLLTQCIGRAIQNLPVTPLEIATVAYVPIAALTYIAWWSKPQDIAVPTVIPIGNLDVTSIPDWNQDESANNLGSWRSVVVHRMQANARPTDWHLNLFALVLASVFGGVHLLSWSYPFPSSLEMHLWRLASVFALICGFCFHVLVNALRRMLQGKRAPKREELTLSKQTTATITLWFYDYFGYLLIPMYVFSRVYIVFESLYSLRSLPPRTFDIPAWTQYVPS